MIADGAFYFIFQDLRGRREGTSPVLERLWLEKIAAHSRKERSPPSDCSGLVLKSGVQPSLSWTARWLLSSSPPAPLVVIA